MVDGTRRRRSSDNNTKSRWYAMHRAQRFRRRFGWPVEIPPESQRACCTRFDPRPASGNRGQAAASW